MARILPYPWSLLAPRNSPGADLSTDDCDRHGALNPETVVFYTRTDESLPELANHRSHRSLLAENVTINPETELGRRPGALWILPWPQDGLNSWKFRLNLEERQLVVVGALRRASARDVPNKAPDHATSLRDVIDHMCGYFAEARTLATDLTGRKPVSLFEQAVVNLLWENIWDRWLQSAAGTEPRTARVVEIARSHVSRIRDVCERPRRMLIRQREQISVGKIQELDETCLRDLIRRPGRTVPEKAGSRQLLLGITRRETVDTAENRVIRDFIQLCQQRAIAYRREYPKPAPIHPKVQAVLDLKRHCENWDTYSPIAGASNLVGLPKSNYVLEKDRRYSGLWKQYQLLRKEEEIVDKIWPWARRLWADFTRSLFIGFLSAQARTESAAWRPIGTLPAYLRAEHSTGAFVPALSVSSRWQHTKTNQELWIIHSAHAHLFPFLNFTVPRIGADMIVAIVEKKSDVWTLTGMLTVHSVLSLETKVDLRDAAVESLADTLECISKLHTEVPRIRGLLLRGDYLPGVEPKSRQTGKLDDFAAFAGSAYWFTEFPVLVSVLLEEIRS